MCHYCGCRQIALIRDFIAEHERATRHGGLAVRALNVGDVATAETEVALMAAELRSHWVGEETGLFAVMRREPQYAEYIEPLVEEHRELDALLTRLDLHDPADQLALRTAIAELDAHIEKEEDGLFPAALVELTATEWQASKDAWYAAHPGQELIPD